MEASFFADEGSHAPLHKFVGGMINSWLDQSSMQQDGRCCPSRNLENVILQYNAATLEPGRLAVVTDGDYVVATMIINQDQPWSRSANGGLLNVHPDARGRGAGRLLLSFVLSTLAKRGVRRLQLETWLGNEPALALFQSTGGLITGRTPGRTVMTDNWLPKVLASAHDPDFDADIAGGRFRARAERDEVLVRLHVTSARGVSDWLLLPT